MKKNLLIPALLLLLIGCNKPDNAQTLEELANTDWHNEPASEFIINTAEGLAGLAKLVNDGNDFNGKTVKLGADIMLNDTANWQDWENKPPKNKWIPIGNYNNPFKGTFDGKSFIVSGVYISDLDDNQGLFGHIHCGGTIEKLRITASYIEGKDNVGGLVGRSYDSVSISNSYFSGSVKGENFVGGFIGHSEHYFTDVIMPDYIPPGEGNISSSYSTGKVTGKNYVGGFAGGNMGTIINSYSASAVKGEKFVGGFAGGNVDMIRYSYSIGEVTGKENIGGFVGTMMYGWSISYFMYNSYYDMETSGQSDEGKGEGKTTAEMKQQSTFANWDFDDIWGISNSVNNGYPYLRTMQGN